MILAQDGHGPSDKIEKGIEKGYLDGVIYSIKYRTPESLPHTVSAMMSKNPEAIVMLDTHFYASEMAMTSAGKIPDYQFFKTGLTRKDFSSIKNISNYARSIVDYQVRLGLTNIILPSLTLSNFHDANSILSLQLYEAAIDYLKETDRLSQVRPYLSLVFHENALTDNENLSQYLDEITLIQEVAGFYIVVERPSNSYPQWQDSRTLAKLMYIVNTLSANYDVICGFMDFPGIVLLSAGANHIASGWHQTLRQYKGSYFMKTKGRNNGKFRYPSKELLTQLLSNPDISSIINRGFAETYIDSEYGSGLMDTDNMQMSPLERVLLQWKSYKNLGEKIVSSSDPLGKLEEIVTSASDRNKELLKANVVLDQQSLNHYEVWKQSINTFKNGVL